MADSPTYFWLGEEGHVETETVYNSLGLDGPHVSANEIKSCATMALHFDDSAYFRALDGNIYVHWKTEQPTRLPSIKDD